MASKEERDKIMAEYLQAINQQNHQDDEEEEEEEEEEDEYQDDDDDTNADEEEGASDSYNDEDDDNQDEDSQPPKDENYAVLNGHLILNDEGRLVYSGHWCMKKDLEMHESLDEKEKKKTKFKLKSKQVLGNEKGGKLSFDLVDPLLGGGEKEKRRTRTILMDGFFTTDKTDMVQAHRKIKEYDVEFTFSQGVPMKRKSLEEKEKQDQEEEEEENDDGPQDCFVITGKGMNEFGSFSLEGIYCPNHHPSKDGQPLRCSKRYIFSSASGKRSREYDDSEEDYVMSEDEAAAADMEELIGLADDAELSVEELRKKYYGGSGGGGDAGEKTNGASKEEEPDQKMPAKRIKTSQVKHQPKQDNDDDEDDGCGF